MIAAGVNLWKLWTIESNFLRLYRKNQKVVSACLPATSSWQVRYAHDAICTQMVSPYWNHNKASGLAWSVNRDWIHDRANGLAWTFYHAVLSHWRESKPQQQWIYEMGPDLSVSDEFLCSRGSCSRWRSLRKVQSLCVFESWFAIFVSNMQVFLQKETRWWNYLNINDKHISTSSPSTAKKSRPDVRVHSYWFWL